MAKANTLTGRQSWVLRDWIASQPEAAERTNGTLASQATSACGFTVTKRNIETALADVGIVRPKRERKAAPVAADELTQLHCDLATLAEVVSRTCQSPRNRQICEEIINRNDSQLSF